MSLGQTASIAMGHSLTEPLLSLLQDLQVDLISNADGIVARLASVGIVGYHPLFPQTPAKEPESLP